MADLSMFSPESVLRTMREQAERMASYLTARAIAKYKGDVEQWELDAAWKKALGMPIPSKPVRPNSYVVVFYDAVGVSGLPHIADGPLVDEIVTAFEKQPQDKGPLVAVVGQHYQGDMYLAGDGDNAPVGHVVQNSLGSFRKVMVPFPPFGSRPGYKKES